MHHRRWVCFCAAVHGYIRKLHEPVQRACITFHKMQSQLKEFIHRAYLYYTAWAVNIILFTAWAARWAGSKHTDYAQGELATHSRFCGAA